jgi:hypothetical protein
VALTPHVMGSMHHHKVNSPASWIHSDYNFANFLWNPNKEGMNPWTPGTNYQLRYDPHPHVLKSVRAISMVYYFGNEPWTPGDGGETGFFKSPRWEDVFFKSPPLNNTLCAFEVSPHSYHAFDTNTKNVRNSVAFWYHSEVLTAVKKFNAFPPVSQ